MTHVNSRLLNKLLDEIPEHIRTPFASMDPAFIEAAVKAKQGLITFARYEGEAEKQAPRKASEQPNRVMRKKAPTHALYDTCQQLNERHGRRAGCPRWYNHRNRPKV